MDLVARLMRGELGLSRTFWVGAPVSAALVTGAALLTLYAGLGTWLENACTVLSLVGILAWSVLLTTAIWRSADRRPCRRDPLAQMARAAALTALVLNVVGVFAIFAGS